MTLDKNLAFVLRAIGDASIEEKPIPKLTSPWDVRVHVAQTGICGSDLHFYDKGRIGDFILTTPIILGHESSGTIVEVGSAVKGVKVGDRVAIEPGVPCRRCDYCRAGRYNLCPDTVFAATPPHDGTLSKYYVVASDYVYKLPDHVDMEQGAMVEPVACAVQMTRTGQVRGDQVVVVFGCGPIGVLCQAVSKASGARRVIGIDISESRTKFALSFGSDDVFVPPTKPADIRDNMKWSEKLAKIIKDEFDLGEGPDVVIEATGAASCIQTGVHLVKKGGMFVQAGMGSENVEFPITIACIRDLTIRGAVRYQTGCYPTAVELVASGRIDVKKLITNRFKFEDAAEAFALVRRKEENVVKVVIEGVQN